MGFFSSIGKFFKKIVSSPIFKVVAIAAAIYFTAGALTSFIAPLASVGAEVGVAAATETGLGLVAGETAASVAAAEAAGVAAETGLIAAGETAALAGEAASSILPEVAESLNWTQSVVDATGTSQAATNGILKAIDSLGEPLFNTAGEFGANIGTQATQGIVNTGIETAADFTGNAASQATQAIPGFTPPEAGVPQTFSTPQAANLGSAAPTQVAPPPEAPTPPSPAGNTSGIPGRVGSPPPAIGDTVSKVTGAETSWWDSLKTGAKELISSKAGALGIQMAVGEGLKAIGTKYQMDQQEQQFEQMRQDTIRRGGNADYSYLFKKNPLPTYKTPGIVEAALGGK